MMTTTSTEDVMFVVADLAKITNHRHHDRPDPGRVDNNNHQQVASTATTTTLSRERTDNAVVVILWCDKDNASVGPLMSADTNCDGDPTCSMVMPTLKTEQ
jgi:hypothetical protein